MKNNNLQSIWKNNIVKETKISSKKELNEIILHHAQKNVHSLYRLTLLACIGGGFMLFLIIATIYRSEDLGYIINNMVLFVFIMICIFLTFYSYCFMYRYKKEQNLKNWLLFRKNALEKSMRCYCIKYYVFPFVVLGAFISVFIPLEDICFKQILGDIGFLLSAALGISVGILFVFRSLRKRKIEYQERIQYLDNLYQQLVE